MTNIFENYLNETGLHKYFKGDESLSIRLYHDLNVYGEDAEMYLLLLRDKYKVDVSKFKFEDYFPAEFPANSFFVDSLINAIPFLRKWYFKNNQFKTFTFDTIKQALKNGTLE